MKNNILFFFVLSVLFNSSNGQNMNLFLDESYRTAYTFVNPLHKFNSLISIADEYNKSHHNKKCIQIFNEAIQLLPEVNKQNIKELKNSDYLYSLKTIFKISSAFRKKSIASISLANRLLYTNQLDSKLEIVKEYGEIILDYASLADLRQANNLLDESIMLYNSYSKSVNEYIEMTKCSTLVTACVKLGRYEEIKSLIGKLRLTSDKIIFLGLAYHNLIEKQMNHLATEYYSQLYKICKDSINGDQYYSFAIAEVIREYFIKNDKKFAIDLLNLSVNVADKQNDEQSFYENALCYVQLKRYKEAIIQCEKINYMTYRLVAFNNLHYFINKMEGYMSSCIYVSRRPGPPAIIEEKYIKQ